MERDPDGSLNLRHEAQAATHVGPSAVADHEALTRHLETHVGEVPSVFHEIVSDAIHLDVLVVDPTPRRPVRTFVTSGMSALPMKPPSGIDAPLHAELMIALPPDWPLDGWDDERRYWPAHLLKTLARLPSAHNTWLATGHTIASGDPAEPYAEGIGFTGAVLLPSFDLPRSFSPLRLSDRTVSFYYVFPLYPEEMEYKLTQGLDALLNRLETVGLGEDAPMINARRPNSCR